MKTKVKKFRFIAKIAQKIACLTACFALSASAASVAKVGETEYETLETAIQAAMTDASGNTVYGVVAEASSIDLGAFITALKAANYDFDGSAHESAQGGKLTVKWSPESGCFDGLEGHACTVGNVKATGNTPKRQNNGLLQFQMFEGEGHAVRVKNVDFVYEPAEVTICINSGWAGTFTADQAPAGQLFFLNTGDVAFEGCSFDKVVLSSFNCTGASTVKGCSFKNVYNNYAVKDIRGGTIAVTGCSFENCGAAVMVSAVGGSQVSQVTISGNTFKNVDVAGTAADGKVGTRGLVQIAAGGDYATANFDFSNNTATDCGPVLRQLNTTVQLDTEDKTQLDALVAAGGSLYTTDSVKPVAATIGTVSYETLDAALAAAKDGETVTLIADVTEDVTVATSVTLDLGGKTLTNAGADKVTLTIAEGKTVTVKNGSIVGGASNYTIRNNGTATFEDVTATAGNVGSSMLDNFGTLTINSGNYSGGLNVVKSEEGSTLLITGGTFTLGYASSSGYTAVITVYGDTTITGGTFIQKATGKWINAQVVMTGVVDGYTSITRVKGGTFVNNATRATCKIFHGIGNATSDNFEVSGGTFNKSISDGFCSAGFIPKANGDGTFGVKEGAYVAAIGSTKYETLSAALAAAKAGKTVTLIADVTEDVTVATSVTLDLGGKTLTNAGAGKVTLTIAEGKTVTVKNGSIVGGASNYTIQNNGTATFEDVTATAGNVGSSMLDNFGTLTINSGTYVGGMNTVKNEPKATLTINGGTFENSYGENNAHTGVIYNLGHVAITGGKLTQKATGPMWAGPHVVMTDWDGSNKPSVAITGGTFTSVWTSYRATIINDAGGGTAGCTTVSGGTFNKKVPENYCAEGYEPVTNADGTYGVKATSEIVTVKTAVGAETTISVRIPNALMETVAGETLAEKVENLSKADANDNLAWVNLVAGIASAKKVTMAAPQNGKADVINVNLPAVGTAPAGTDVTVRYEIRAEGSDAAVVSATAAEDLVINLNGKAGIGTYRAYVCLLQNGTEVARVASENALGVLQTVSAAKKAIIAVPWLSLTDGNAIAVADLVKTAGLTAGDKLHVYNKAESRYDVYELAADRAWMPKAIYKVGADGTVEADSSGTPETTTVARGNGVWLERQDTTKAIVSYGQVSSGTVATTIDAGAAEKPTWNLLAVPTTTAVNIAATFGTSSTDTLIVPTDGAPKVCTVKDGAWGYEKAVSVTDKFGNQTGVKVVRETVTELPAGTGFWYLNGGAAKAVNW